MKRARASLVVVAALLSAPAAFAQTAPSKDPWSQSPAKAADPPEIPPPAQGEAEPLSTSGTDLTTARPASSADGTTAASVLELEARLKRDEAKISKLEESLGIMKDLKLQGYVQAQYLLSSYNAAASPNATDGTLPAGISANDVIAKRNGTTTNSNAFRLRRTRLRTIYETRSMRVFFQVDLLPAGGPSAAQGTIARNAEATGIARWSNAVRTEFTVGLIQVPFLPEVLESSMYRPFIDRTTMSQNLFPSERDLGAHAKTILLGDRLSIDVGLLNGHRLGEPNFTLTPDLNRAKDLVGIAILSLGPVDLTISGYLGRGENVDPVNLRVKNYPRYAGCFGFKAVHSLFPKLGESRAYGELMFGRNMDTGVNYPFAVPSIPVNLNDDVVGQNERGVALRVEQELTRWALAGFRFDTYTTNSTIKNNAADTYTFMAGARFTRLLRLINEATFIVDNNHAEGTLPPSKHTFTYTAWLQGSFY